MKYLPSPDFDEINGALNFDTSDCNVTGACELYSTKSTGSDKKFLRQIDQDLTDKHNTLVRLSESLPPPESADFLATSPNMRLFTKDSAFGPLREGSNRRTFAYLIATLNASHQHYDFSNCLRPADFRKLRDISPVRGDLDASLQRFRHSNGGNSGEEFDGITGPQGAKSAAWGPRCWAIIDKEIDLARCTIFRYSPESDPFKDDEGAIWSAHYLFFNRDLKRVVYLYARMVPVLSSQSPPEHLVGSMGRGKRSHTGGTISGGAHKRARFWLGDTDPSLIETFDDDDSQTPDDGFYWNRGEDGHLMMPDEDCTPPSDDDGYDEDEEDFDEDDDENETDTLHGVSIPVRGVSEEMVSAMEM